MDEHGDNGSTVERRVTVEADGNEVWRTLTEPDELEAWLGTDVELEAAPGAAGRVTDDDGTARRVVVEEVEVGRRIQWRWWPEADEGAASSVEITLPPCTHGTEVVVTEIRCAAATGPAGATSWEDRLLALELLLLCRTSV